jgi:anti-sigma B factor antagonist
VPVPLIFEKRVEGGCLILKAAGDFAEHDCGTFISTVRRGILPGVTRVILDMDGVGRISSAALTELAAERHRLADAGCQLVLACANDKVRKLLSLSLLDKAVTTVDSVEKALNRSDSPTSRDSQRILGPDGLVG